MRMYFTFGNDEVFPYKAGEYVVVEGNDADECKSLFRSVHPDATKGVLNCSDYYPEHIWKGLSFYERYEKTSPREYIRVVTTIPKTYEEMVKDHLIEDAKENVGAYAGALKVSDSTNKEAVLKLIDVFDEETYTILAERYMDEHDSLIADSVQWYNLIERFIDHCLN